MNLGLANKVAIVTGGTRGIGAAITKTLANEMCHVYPIYKENETAASEIVEYNPTFIHPLKCDITIESKVLLMLKEVGPYNFLINNAGINRPASLDEISVLDYYDIMEVNLHSPFWMIRKSLDLKLLLDEGVIVNIGSVSGFNGGPRSSHYCISKSALVGMTQNVARFLAPRNIRCNLVAPGYIESPMSDAGAQSDAVKKQIEQIPLGRLGYYQEVADVVVFLCSYRASYITGQVIHVNGGLYW